MATAGGAAHPLRLGGFLMSDLDFDGRVVIVTGAGNGLGRSHAKLFAAQGAKVVVNDLGGDHTGGGQGTRAADQVVSEIRDAGGEAVPNYDSVVDGDEIVAAALEAFGRVDVVVNNAGILRDVSFHKMTQEDWDLVYQVHVLGSMRVTKAAWPHFREQRYGRVVMTASAAGIYGNFGQANYAMAKLGLAGFASTLAIEGRKRNVLVNTIAPIAGSRMTETVLPPKLLEALDPAYVSPLVVWLASEACEESGGLFEVGGGYMGKLRWERTAGKMWRIGRDITPAQVRDAWDRITDFSESEHPADVNASFGPIMENIERGPSRGGNRYIDVDEALGYRYPPTTSSYDQRDLALYALGVGAAQDPAGRELDLVYESHGDGFRALPSYAVVPIINLSLEAAKEGARTPGLSFGFDRILHGEQYTKLERPLPPKATLRHEARIESIYDKGKHALVVTRYESFDEDGDLLMTNVVTTLARGCGGWGGDRGPSEERNVPPDRAPDFVVEEKTAQNQALLYRLSGDWNPLHVDPAFASAAGYDRPILHGLCTFGFATRAVLSRCAPDGDYRYFESIRVRFAKTVFPGETLVTEMWKEDERKVVFRTKVKERDEVVLSHAAITLYETIPTEKSKAKAVALDAPAASGAPIPADYFSAIGAWMGENAADVQKVGKVFQFALRDPSGAWTVDTTAATVTQGEGAKPDCTLELTTADFLAMMSGEKDATKMYFGGELKIGGDVMASQKLGFLKKVGPEHLKAAMAARGGGAAEEAPSGPVSGDFFRGIGAWMAENAAVVNPVDKVFRFELSDPGAAWTLDCKRAVVEPGETAPADCVLALSDEDFIAMMTGEKNAQKMYFGGELKVTGDVMASQKLGFLQKVDRAFIERAAAGRASGGVTQQAAAPPAPAREAVAPKVFEALRVSPGGGRRIQVRVTEPDGAWLVDLDAGEVKPGDYAAPDATVTLRDEALERFLEGEVNEAQLFQQGEMRVDGDVEVARDLSFLKGAG
jgi:3-hydroxyacyl-CoA dehydrogenase/3a,7a,12a-trihydroxy-5b-cholest-24-enoyl-CoA hydratase